MDGMKNKVSNHWLGYVIAVVVFVGPFVPGMYRHYVEGQVEKAAWIWTRGEVFCTRCHCKERIESVVVRAVEKAGGLFNVYLGNRKHKGEVFVGVADVDGTTIKSLRVKGEPVSEDDLDHGYYEDHLDPNW